MVPAARQFLLIIHVIKSSAVWTAVRKQGVLTDTAAVGALDAAVLSCRKDKGIEHAGIEFRLLMHQFPMHEIFFRKDHTGVDIICFGVITSADPDCPSVIIISFNQCVLLLKPLFMDLIADHLRMRPLPSVIIVIIIVVIIVITAGSAGGGGCRPLSCQISCCVSNGHSCCRNCHSLHDIGDMTVCFDLLYRSVCQLIEDCSVRFSDHAEAFLRTHGLVQGFQLIISQVKILAELIDADPDKHFIIGGRIYHLFFLHCHIVEFEILKGQIDCLYMVKGIVFLLGIMIIPKRRSGKEYIVCLHS